MFNSPYWRGNMIRTCWLLNISFFLAFKIYLRALQYKHCVSVPMYICTHPHCSYSGSSSFNLPNHTASCAMRLGGYCAGESTAVHEVKVGNMVRRRRINSAPIDVELESTSSRKSDDTGPSSVRSAVLDWEFFYYGINKNWCQAVWKKVVEQLEFEKCNIKGAWNTLKSATSCSKLVRESFIRMIENQGLIKEKMRTDEKENTSDGVLYWKKVVEVPKSQLEICTTAGKTGFKRWRKNWFWILNIRDFSVYWKVEYVIGRCKLLPIGYAGTKTHSTYRGYLSVLYSYSITIEQLVWEDPHWLHIYYMRWWSTSARTTKRNQYVDTTRLDYRMLKRLKEDIGSGWKEGRRFVFCIALRAWVWMN